MEVITKQIAEGKFRIEEIATDKILNFFIKILFMNQTKAGNKILKYLQERKTEIEEVLFFKVR
ncbi:hypothetical protein [Natranaerobius trueperi]|uniref:Uncharacterized protein n=1 Tax=Natranaerobius trueperi TaxID=759412 RepID=A0A226BZY6_9FIRM|nr:hypothetical protein [Natranaerobius trueperi]OWZ83680.1 hypothetical protein CDO51_06935 [Natranaerobius trueperi]